MLGEAYRQGFGVRQDFAKAMEWYCAAAADGLGAAMNKCGYSLLIGGPGVAPDRIEALKWLTLAVERTGPGDSHDRATVNLRRALIDAAPREKTEAARLAEDLRRKLPAPDLALRRINLSPLPYLPAPRPGIRRTPFTTGGKSFNSS
jgi:TPR repeat protein